MVYDNKMFEINLSCHFQIEYNITIEKSLLHKVSILGPLGYEPNTLPLRHGADVRGSRQNIQILYLCTKQIIHNFIFALKDTGHAENDGG